MAADISQITILPMQPLQGPQQVAQGFNSQSPPLLPSLPTGTVLQGFIINRDAGGNPILRTDKGDIPFASNFFLKIGSEVVIRIASSGGNSVAHILSVDGQPPEVAQSASSFAQEPEVILSPQVSQSLGASPQTTAAASPQLPAEAAVTIKATVIAPPQTASAAPGEAQAPAAPAPAAFGNGTQLALKIVTIAGPVAATPAPPATAGASPTPTATPQANPAFYATYARAAGALPENTLPATTPLATPAITATPAPQAPAASVALPPSLPQNPALPAATPPAVLPNTAAIPAPAIVPNATAAIAIPVATPAVATIPAVSVTVMPTPSETLMAPVAVSIQPPAPTPLAVVATVSPANPAQPGAIIIATVIGHESSGEALLQTPVGVIRLQIPAAIPSGSTVTFELVESTPPAPLPLTEMLAASAEPAPITELAQQWNSLQQVVTLLAGSGSAPGLDALLASIPGSLPVAGRTANSAAPPLTAQSITSSLFVFLSALQNGDLTRWLGADAVRQLRDQGHDDVLKKLQSEFTGLTKQFTQNPENHWQPLFFPLIVEGNVQQVRIFTKRDRKQGASADRKEEDTRFVIELDLSQLGELQMDGFVRRQGKEINFDMVIRSLSGLPPDIEANILSIYNNMGEITGYKGSLSFQAVREFPVNPMEDIVAAGHAVIV